MTNDPSTAQNFIEAYLSRGDATGWFEEVYAGAHGNAHCVPWAHMAPRKEVVEWAFEAQPDGAGRSALVIGCGLGDDAEFLAGLGYSVTAFDVSQTAVGWCRQRFPSSAVHYQVADMFDPPLLWKQAFDLVVEVYIVQALPPSLREASIAAVAAFVAPGGTLLAVGRGIEEGQDRNGPPWALTSTELALFKTHDLSLIHMDRRSDRNIAPHFRYRAEYRRLDSWNAGATR